MDERQMSKLDNFVSRLNKAKRTGKDSWIACCPAHQDKNPSMTIKEVQEGMLLVHCFAGCSITDIVGAIGMDLSDLMPDRVADEVRKPSKIPFNARDVLECIKSDATLLCVFISDTVNNKQITASDAANAYKAAARIVAATQMGGVE